ncbi:hypothetical protein LCGC14_0124650 [marine sediment metagenome]|uniref:ABC transporter n=1 Tax=marine sediment metagenome TaxID=412755 RepID=A0A0F9V611_9ZZZZ|nr:ABC transporter ATP-binding protein [Phycisphaerae bacterium]HDZ43639.1 ABC transporter ATP-binding protein [Phycisphaerae bacterium]
MKQNTQANPLDGLSKDLIEHLHQTQRHADVVAAVPYDLDEHGKYTEGYLLLTDSRLGHFRHRDGQWMHEWLEVGELDEATLVEGLGMNLLQLMADGRLVAEYRFTLQHSRELGRFHRHLEGLVHGESHQEQDEGRPRHGDEQRGRCPKCDRPIPSWSEVCRACMSRRKILWRLLDFVIPYKDRAIASFLLALTMTGLALLTPLLSRWLIDDGLGAGPGKQANWAIVLMSVGGMLGLLMFRAIGQWGQSRLSGEVARRVARAIRHAVYAHMHRLSLDFFAKRQTGALVTRVTNDTERLWSFTASIAIEMVLAILTIVGVGVALFLMNWKLAMFALMPVPLMIFLTAFFHKRLHRSFRQQWHRWSQMTAVVADALPGMRVIKAFSQEQREVDRFEERSTALFDEERNYIRGAKSLFAPTMMFATSLSTLIIYLVAGWTICSEWSMVQAEPKTATMTFGTMMAFLFYMNMFLRPVHQLAHMDEQLNRAATSAQRIFEILDTEPRIYTKADAHTPDTIEGRIELRNVSFSYDGVNKVLKNINLTIEPGEMIGLVGPSGAGKTTMVNLICRFYDVIEGQILIDGVDIRDYDIGELRRKIGMVLQEPFLFHGPIGENIAYGMPEASSEEIITAARAANANNFIINFPDGYDTMVGERGQTLSGGERQRISISRAILHNPSLLILDEATSSVDTETEETIQKALDGLTASRTTIAIAHRLSTLRKADRLVVIDKGLMVEQGSHDELARKDGGLYARLLQKQQEMQSYIALQT